MNGNGVHEIGVCLTPAELRSWLYEACGKGFGGTEWAAPAPRMTGATAIVAGILVARHLKTADDLFDPKPSPRTESMVAAAVQWADRIMRRIDNVFGKD